MTTSGQYQFNPALGELVIYAYNLCGIRATALIAEHMEAARMASNMLLARYSNQGVNLWAVDKQEVPLFPTISVTGASGTGTVATLTYASVNTPVYTVGTTIQVAGVNPAAYNGTFVVTASSPGSVSFLSSASAAYVSGGTITTNDGITTFSVNPNTVVLLDAYLRGPQSGQLIDRIILPISRTEYSSYPNKQQQGVSTVFWFDRLISPTVTIWPVPAAGNGYDTLVYYRVRQIQDAGLAGGQNVEIPYLWMEAFAYGLAERLAMIWAPEKVMLIKPMADESYDIAARQNVETAQQYISPTLSGYFR